MVNQKHTTAYRRAIVVHVRMKGMAATLALSMTPPTLGQSDEAQAAGVLASICST